MCRGYPFHPPIHLFTGMQIIHDYPQYSLVILLFLLGIHPRMGAGVIGEGALVISEFQALNENTLADEEGDYSDWIEIYNPNETDFALAGFHLTDDPRDLQKWTFPDVRIAPFEYLLVFASGKDRRGIEGPLHTNFRLQGSGEFLALVEPGGEDLVHGFEEAFPPQFQDLSYGMTWTVDGFTEQRGYFQSPTPGEPNGEVHVNPGPFITEPTTSISRPPASLDMSHPGRLRRLTVEVEPTSVAIQSVHLYYRFMYEPEIQLSMNDDGVDADERLGDGVYSVYLPISGLRPGEMIRWRFAARDSEGQTNELPEYFNPNDSPRYYGTIAQDEIESRLPIFHWFIQRPASANTVSGTRGSAFYLGRFYDNIRFDLHGQSTTSFPKKSYDVDFNRGDRFIWDPNEPVLKDVNLLTNWADKTKLRNTLAYEYFRKAGVPAHFAFPVRVQQNGVFFSVADFVEDGDDVYLDRAGLDPEGVLYKMYNNLSQPRLHSIQGVEKKTRKEENNTDLRDFLNGIHLPPNQLTAYVYDHVNIPMCVNFIAANSLISNTDLHAKNYYLYHDIRGTGEWTLLPWDLDLSWGRQWNSQDNYFDDTLFVDRSILAGRGNYLVQLLTDMPQIRSMVLRRIRTLSDQFLQPPHTPIEDRVFENRIFELVEMIDPQEAQESDADLDYRRWRSWGNGNNMREEVDRLLTEYLPGRRHFIYVLNSGRGRLIPPAQVPNIPIEFGQIDFKPVTGQQEEEFIEIINLTGTEVDISHWSIQGDVEFVFHPGTVLPASGRLYVSPNVNAFRARTLSPRGREGRFVTGKFRGFLPDAGGQLWILDNQGREVARLNYQGNEGLTFERWREGYFDPTISWSDQVVGRDADPDRDGWSNWLEYALLTNPQDGADRPEMTMRLLSDAEVTLFELTFPYQSTATDLEYAVQSSLDLSHWTLIQQAPIKTDSGRLKYELPGVEEGTTATFFRLRIQ